MSILLILKLYNRYVFLSMEMKAMRKAKSRGENFHRDLFDLFVIRNHCDRYKLTVNIFSTLSFPTTL